MQPTVMLAEDKDIPILNEISIESKRYWNYPNEWIDKWRDDLTVTGNSIISNSVFKLLLGNRIIGFCSISNNPDHYEIEHLWIKPEYIGKGFGKYLLNESLRKSVKEKKRIIVISDPNSEKFYIKNGFKCIDKVESFPEGRFLPLMEKR